MKPLRKIILVGLLLGIQLAWAAPSDTPLTPQIILDHVKIYKSSERDGKDIACYERSHYVIYLTLKA